MFTLAKNWSEVVKSVIVWYQALQLERRIIEELKDKKYDCQVVGHDERTTNLVRDLIKQRQKCRNSAVTVIQNALRIMMLSYRLKFPIKKYIHPIFYTVCGIVSNIFSIFKIWSNEASHSYTHKRLFRVTEAHKRTH